MSCIVLSSELVPNYLLQRKTIFFVFLCLLTHSSLLPMEIGDEFTQKVKIAAEGKVTIINVKYPFAKEVVVMGSPTHHPDLFKPRTPKGPQQPRHIFVRRLQRAYGSLHLRGLLAFPLPSPVVDGSDIDFTVPTRTIPPRVVRNEGKRSTPYSQTPPGSTTSNGDDNLFCLDQAAPSLTQGLVIQSFSPKKARTLHRTQSLPNIRSHEQEAKAVVMRNYSSCSQELLHGSSSLRSFRQEAIPVS